MRLDLVRRFFAKVLHDVLPAALASLIGGFLLTHYGFGRQPVLAQATPASAEMMDLLRDEHALVVNYLRAQMANERRQALAAKDDAQAAAANIATAEPSVPAAAPGPQPVIAAVKPPHAKPVVVGASLPPLVIAQTQPSEDAKSAPLNDEPLFAKTFKDQVIAATQRAVSVIGVIPAWFGAIGDRIGGENANPRPRADLVSAS